MDIPATPREKLDHNSKNPVTRTHVFVDEGMDSGFSWIWKDSPPWTFHGARLYVRKCIRLSTKRPSSTEIIHLPRTLANCFFFSLKRYTADVQSVHGNVQSLNFLRCKPLLRSRCEWRRTQFCEVWCLWGCIIWVRNVSFNIYNTKRFVSSSNSKRVLLQFTNRFLVTFNPLCATFLYVRSHLLAAFVPKLICLGQATTESHHSVHSHRTLDSSYFNICSSQKALRTMCRRFRDKGKWLGRDSS